MDRIFLNHRKEKCTNGCSYCFAQWDVDNSNYDDDTRVDYKKSVIIYPLCNNDILSSDDFDEMLKYLERCLSTQSSFSVLSLSTKSILPQSFIMRLDQINKQYRQRGFIKISVSFSCKNMITELEPNTASYGDRISLLKELAYYRIPNSAILKPVLPFIKTEEYCEIIKDVSSYTDVIILGGLYINKDDAFYERYIKGKYEVVEKVVSWLKKKPLWLVVESLNKMSQLKKYAIAKGLRCYDSDAEHLISLAESGDERN